LTASDIDHDAKGAEAGQHERVSDEDANDAGHATETGSGLVVSFKAPEASGSGGMMVASAIPDSGALGTSRASFTVDDHVSANGTAMIKGSGIVDFAEPSSANVVFGAGSAGTLKLEDSFHFDATISGFSGADAIDLMDVNAATAAISYHQNAQGTGGVLTISDGAHSAQLSLIGHYSADNFAIVPDRVHGALVSLQHDLHV